MTDNLALSGLTPFASIRQAYQWKSLHGMSVRGPFTVLIGTVESNAPFEMLTVPSLRGHLTMRDFPSERADYGIGRFSSWNGRR